MPSDPNPFAPSKGLAFLTGLASSTMSSFKDEHDRRQKEDDDRKKMDYQLLMDALKARVNTGNITPSEVNQITTRAVDIFKPKGHQDIKDKLNEIFGGGQPYEMQAGQILGSAKPKVDVGTVQGGTTPSTFGGGVTLPPPPDMPYSVKEPTLREQDLQDKLDVVGGQTEKALSIEERRQKDRIDLRDHQNAAILERFKEEQGIKDDSQASKKLRERASFFGDPDDPSNQERARISLQQELDVKHEYSQSRIEVNRQRVIKMNADIKAANDRINIAKQRLGAVKAANWDKDPQVKGAWAKVNEQKGVAQTARTQAAKAYGEGDTKMGEYYDGIAERAETTMQGTIDNIEQRVGYLNGGVQLPGPPTRGEDPRVRAYADKYFQGDYQKALDAARKTGYKQ